MPSGVVFRAYVEAIEANKTKLAEAMGMSKQNLYQLFKSKELSAETVKSIERVLRVKWTDIAKSVESVNIEGNIYAPALASQKNPGQQDWDDPKDEIISLQRKIIELQDSKLSAMQERLDGLSEALQRIEQRQIDFFPKLLNDIGKVQEDLVVEFERVPAGSGGSKGQKVGRK